MAYPPAYTRAYSFTDFETLNPGEPKPGDKLDTEYDAVSNALTATQTALALIQRADGALANESVGEDQLQAGLFDAIGDAAVADAEAAAAAAAASASAAAGSASSASTSASAASASAGVASGAAAQAGVSQGIAQDAANEAALSAAEADAAADVSVQAANDTAGSVAATEAAVQRAFEWAELLTGPVLPAPPGWPEAVDDGMFSSKWWAIRAREFNSVETIDLGTAGADIGEAFDIWDAIPGNDLGPGLTYATWGSPVQTYVLTDRSDPSNPASWTNITGGPGPAGPPNTLTIGTVTTGAVGSPAAATITGASPDQVLNLTLPTGATGATGGIGPAGPPNALSIGTVTTVPDGTPSSATITGTAPTQTLNLTLTAGPQGIQGPIGPVGPVGPAVNLADPTGLIGLAAVNGVATTAPRSDSRHAIDQAIAPAWTGVHRWGGAAQSDTRISNRGDFRTNAFEWGHANTGGFANTIGYGASNGAGFIAFNAEHGTATNTWRTRGVIGRIIQGDVGTLRIGRAALATADDQTLTTDMTVAADGTVTFQGRVNTVGELHAGALITYLEHAGGPVLKYVDTDAATDDKNWRTRNANGAYIVSSENDAGTEVGQALNFVKVSGVITTMNFGNVTHNPAFNFLGTGAVSFGGSITGRPAVFAVDSAVSVKIQGINSTPSGMVGTQSNHPLEIRTNNAIRGTFAADGTSLSLLCRLILPVGSVAAPALVFSGDGDTGLYYVGTDSIGLSIGGVLRYTFDASALTSTERFRGPNGLVATPTFSFSGDPDTGIYRAAEDDMRLVAGGVAQVVVQTGLVNFTPIVGVADGAVGSPGIRFVNDTNTGMYRAAGDDVAISAGGVAIAHFTSNSGATPQLRIVDGVVGNCGLAFHADPDTGFYRWGPDAFAAASGGAPVMSWRLGQSRITDGTAAAPALCFENDTDTGIYLSGTNSFTITCGAAPQLSVSPASFNVAPAAAFASTVSATSFTSTSSRAIKRETGAPRKPADILARLRPLMYRLLAGNDREQLGLIAEEVHEVCPQLSDGKTVAYDRLAILLLAAWQDEHAEAA